MGLIALLSDIHGNLPALEAVLADMPPVSAVWVLGDTIGELPFPRDVMARLRVLNQQVPVTCIRGNREEALLEAWQGKHPGWWAGTQLRLLAWTVDQLGASDWADIRSWSHPLAMQSELGTALLCHGTPEEIKGVTYGRGQARASAACTEAEWVLCGHIHRPAVHFLGRQTVVNAGSVGMSHDGMGWMACYALIDRRQGSEEPAVAIRHVNYDAGRILEAMRRNGFFEMAPGIAQACAWQMETGYHYMTSLIGFCRRHAQAVLGEPVETVPPALWREAERMWIEEKRRKMG